MERFLPAAADGGDVIAHRPRMRAFCADCDTCTPSRVEPGRRRFLTGAAAMGAVAILPSRVRAQAAETRRIDFHHHFFPPEWVKLVERRHATRPVLGIEQFREWSVTRDLESMDKGNVERAFLSVTQPGVWFGDPAETRRLAREMNEYAARLKADHKPRYGFYAVLPLPDVDASLREIEHAFDVLGADGVGLLSSYGDTWIGDPALAPVWAELDRRKAIVYTHATAHDCCSWNFQPGILPTFVELGADLARAMVSIVQGGTAARTPNVRYVWSHGGGSIWAQRYLTGETVDSLRNPSPQSRLTHFRRFFYDTAAAADALHIGILKMVVPTSQIVFGSDYPWGDPSRIANALRTAGLTASELGDVYRNNARSLVPGLA